MKRRLFKTFVALLAIAAAATGPARAQNATTYNVTFSGFNYPELNTTVNVASLPQTFTSNFNPPSVIDDVCYGFTNAYVTSGGEGNVSASVVTFTEMSITVNGTFEGTATIHVTGKDDEERDISTDVYVSCVAVAPAAPTPHTVTFAEGTEDVGNWSFTPEAAAITGVTAGTVVTVKYNGTRRIESIELKSKMLTTPLTMEALTAGTVVVNNPRNGMQYTLNGGAKQPVCEACSTATINVAAGDKVAFYGNGTSITNYEGTSIAGGTANVKVYGNVMSLVNEEHFDTATTLTTNYQFYSLFENNEHLKDASGLMLPATTLALSCYSYMFSNCTSLTAAPAELPATTLASNCYAYMFYGCSSLTTAPALPATTLANDCYAHMFRNCTSLTTAPELPAQTLVSYCYYNMFTNCTKLNSVTCLATSGINQNYSTENWLNGAGSNVTGTMTFNAASLVEWPDGANGIPSGWTLVTPAHTPLTLEALTDGTVKVQSPKSGMQYTLNGGAKTPVTSAAIDVVAGDKVAFYGNGTSITCYDGTRIAGGDADVKVYGNIMSLVNETGFATATTLSGEYQFYNLFEENNHLKDASGLLLPATTLASTCYAYMFNYCSSLTAAPAELPATTLAEGCYRGMFQDCRSLTTAPELPATTLTSNCYAYMFQNCTKLNSVTCMATSGINQNSSTDNWLDNAGTDQSVTTKTFNAASSAEWPTSVHGIPEGWTLGAQSTPEPVTLVPTGNTNEWTLTMPADNMLLMVNYAPTYTVRFADGNNGWQVQDVTSSSAAVTAPAVLQNVMAGDSLVVTAPATLPGKVKSVKAVKYVAPPFASVTTEDIGKIIGADGNIYDNAAAATAAGTTASAIIAYVGTAGSVDASSSTYKGLAIALTDANGGSNCQWYTANSGTCVSQTNAIATAITYKNGIASTNTLTSDGHTHAAATAASSYSTARPSDVSAWFLPSMGQWNLIVQGLATKKAGSTVSTNLSSSSNSAYQATNLNTVITAAGGTGFQSSFYWSSTEYSTSYAWRMRFTWGDVYGKDKNENGYVRAVFAF